MSNRIIVSFEASQASMDGVEVVSSRCFYGHGFTTLRVESLRVRRLAKRSLLFGGRSWGLPDICLSLLPSRWYPYISKTFNLPPSYQHGVHEDMESILQSPYHDHLIVYVDTLEVGLRFPS